MSRQEIVMSSQLNALKKNDLSPLIRIGGAWLPSLLKGFLPKLDEKQRNAFDKVMPEGGEKRIYLHLTDTPTPPIVVGMAQPPKMSTMSKSKVKEQEIKGIRLTVDDLQLLADGLTPGNILRLFWRLIGQIFTILCILWMFVPFLLLGPTELKDLGKKAASHFKPLFDLLPCNKQ